MKTIICMLFLTLAITALSQTNPAPVIPVAPEQIVVSNADQALGAFIHYKAPSINFENAVKLAGSLMAIILVGARYLRKIIPDSWQVNKAGLALAHVAERVAVPGSYCRQEKQLARRFNARYKQRRQAH